MKGDLTVACPNEELFIMTAAMFDMLKTISTRINELEKLEFIDWSRFFKWHVLMDDFVVGCGIPEPIRTEVMESYILPGLEEELDPSEVVRGIMDAVAAYRNEYSEGTNGMA